MVFRIFPRMLALRTVVPNSKVSGTNALTASGNVLSLNGHSSPCRFTYLCVKEPTFGDGMQ